MNGIQHILQGIGGMGIVDDCRITLRRANRIKSAVYTFKGTHRDEDFLGLLAQHHGSTIDTEQVRNIELTYELYAHLATVNLEVHSLEVAFHNTGTEVGHLADAVGLHVSLRVLHHKHAVLVISIGNGKGILAKSVEEGLFSVTIVLNRLVIVQMIAREVREKSASKLQATNTLLGYGMAGALHKYIFTARIGHAPQQFIQLNGVRRRMGGRNSLLLDIVTNGR